MISAIDDVASTYLKLGLPSPFNTVTEMQGLASSIALQTVHPPRVAWNPTFTKLTIDGQILELDKLRSGLQTVYKCTLKHILSLTGSDKVESEVSGDVADNLADRKRGASFLNNPEYAKTHHSVLQRLVTHPSWRICYVGSDRTIHWNMPAIVRFFTLTSMIVEGLSFLLHVVPSMPQRGTEFVDTKIRNTSSRLRNMFFICTELFNIGMYTKMTSLTRHDSFIPSLLPNDLRDEVVEYLVKIRPIEVLLSRVLWDATAASYYEEYLFVRLGRRMTSEDLTRTLQRLFTEHMNVSLGVNAWRHAAVAAQREFVASHYLRGGDRETDLSTGHSTDQARSRYGLEENALQRLTADAMWEYRIIDGIWHDFLGFGRNAPPLPLRLAGLPGSTGSRSTTHAGEGANPGVTSHELNNVLTSSFNRMKEELRNEFSDNMKGAFAWALANLPEDVQSRNRRDARSIGFPKSNALRMLPPSSSAPRSAHPTSTAAITNNEHHVMDLPPDAAPKKSAPDVGNLDTSDVEVNVPPPIKQVSIRSARRIPRGVILPRVS